MVSNRSSVRLGLVELFTHENNLYNLCKIGMAAGHELTIFTTSEMYESLDMTEGFGTDRVSWVIQDDDESLSAFLTRISDRTTDIDLLLVTSIYGTAPELRHFWQFNPDCPVAVWIFNANAWLGGYSVRKGLVGNVNTLARRRILSNVNAIIVEYEPIRSYVETELNNRVVEKVRCFPPVYADDPRLTGLNQEVSSDSGASGIHFVVPGRIEQSRRDYDTVCDVFEMVDPTVANSLRLTLLGKPYGEYGKRIIERCDALTERGVNVTVFNEWIPIDTYRQTLRDATFLLCPLQRTTESASITEVYGRTKGSGNVWDAIQNATPLVVPSHFEVAHYIKSSTYSYESSTDLTDFIERVAADTERIASLQQNALANAKKFSLNNQCNRFDALVSALVTL